MKVAALIDKLKQMPADAQVGHLWDGAVRTMIEHVWLARSGEVVTADCEMVCYSDNDRPSSAPTEAHVAFWTTPKEPSA